MDTIVNAVFRNGVFVPTIECDIPEITEVQVILRGPASTPKVAADPEERARIRREVVQAMRRNPIPANAPRFTREQLHERG
jgi:predicted DNA-binding antitoxin AbrB/MazE fold protein